MRLPAKSTAWTELISRPPLGVHVSQIVAFCAKPKMLRVYASSIVASVADAKSTHYGSAMKFVRKAMGVNQNAAPARTVSDSAIPVAPQSPIPSPASIIAFLNSIPKALQNCSAHINQNGFLLVIRQGVFT